MIREWKNNIIFEFENGYRVKLPYIPSTNIAVPIRVKCDVLGPNNEYLTPNILKEKYNISLGANEIVDILAKVKNITPNENLNIL